MVKRRTEMKGINVKCYICAVAALLSVVFSSTAFSDGEPLFENNRIQNLRPGKQQAGAFTGKPDILFKKAEWQLNTYLTHKGSRSQGSHGVLLKNGKPVTGKKGDTLDTAIGQVKYNGPYGFQEHLWDSSGWVMVEPKVKPVKADFRPPRPSAPDMIKLEKDLNEIQPDKY
jgi:hypothetical protein